MTSPTWPRHALLGMPNMLHSLCCALDTEFSLHRFQLPPVTPGVDRIRANPENDQFAIDGFLDILMTLHILCKRHSRKFVGSLLNRGWTGLPVLVLQMALDQQIHQRQLHFTHKTKLQAKTVDLSYHFISFSQPSLHGLHLVSVSATRSTLHPSSRGDFPPRHPCIAENHRQRSVCIAATNSSLETEPSPSTSIKRKISRILA